MISNNILLDKRLHENSYEIIQFMTFHTKCLWVQNHCELGSIKYMDLLKFITELDIYYYLVFNDTMQFMRGLDF